MTENSARIRCDLADAHAQPIAIQIKVMSATRYRRSVSKPREIGNNRTNLRVYSYELASETFEPVMISSEPVNEHNRRALRITKLPCARADTERVDAQAR